MHDRRRSSLMRCLMARTTRLLSRWLPRATAALLLLGAVAACHGDRDAECRAWWKGFKAHDRSDHSVFTGSVDQTLARAKSTREWVAEMRASGVAANDVTQHIRSYADRLEERATLFERAGTPKEIEARKAELAKLRPEPKTDREKLLAKAVDSATEDMFGPSNALTHATFEELEANRQKADVEWIEIFGICGRAIE